MLRNISNHIHLSRITLDYQEEKSGRRPWYKKRNYWPRLRKTPEKIYHMEGKRYLTTLYQILLLHSSLWIFQQWFPPHNPNIPALRFLNCWVWTAQPILTGGRNEGGSPSPGSFPGSLLPRLTSHVWQRSNESNISFPFSSFGYNSSPGWNRSSHFRHVTK